MQKRAYFLRSSPYIFVVAFLFIISETKAQTFTFHGEVTKEHKSTSTAFELKTKDLPMKGLDTISFGLEKICINSTLLTDEKIEVRLISPDGNDVLLFSLNQFRYEELGEFCLSSQGEKQLSISMKGRVKNYLPVESLGYLNNGQNPNGIWRLYFAGDYVTDAIGEEIDWSITFGKNPAKPFSFSSSNLPVLNISTFNEQIPNEPKILCNLKVIDNGPGIRNRMSDTVYQYNGIAGLELRGSSSIRFPMKSYGMTTYEVNGKPKSVSLLGMPSENDWVLMAPYRDKSLIRNAMTYEIGREMGWYAPRTVFCEVVLNGKYQGVYILIEKIKKGKHRLNISKITPADSSGDALTGGYIIKIDRINGNDKLGWDSPYLPYSSQYSQITTYLYDYPKQDKITEKQKAYLKAYVDSFESCFNRNLSPYGKHFPDFIDMRSFEDFFIITELSKNFDAYRASTFMYKDRDSKGGKLTLGPFWDFDFAWHNSKSCDANTVEGWAYNVGHFCFSDPLQPPFWWDCMMADTTFTNPLRKRWDELRKDVLSEKNLLGFVERNTLQLRESAERNFRMWPQKENILSDQIYRRREDEIADLKQWISQRLVWMDNNLPK